MLNGNGKLISILTLIAGVAVGRNWPQVREFCRVFPEAVKESIEKAKKAK